MNFPKIEEGSEVYIIKRKYAEESYLNEPIKVTREEIYPILAIARIMRHIDKRSYASSYGIYAVTITEVINNHERYEWVIGREKT